MKTKEQIYNFVVGQSYDALAERVLEQAQEELSSKGLENNPLYVSMVFHKIWAEICQRN